MPSLFHIDVIAVLVIQWLSLTTVRFLLRSIEWNSSFAQVALIALRRRPLVLCWHVCSVYLCQLPGSLESKCPHLSILEI